MMKFALVVLAVLATASNMHAFKIPNFGKGPLHDDIQDFVNLLDLDTMASIVLKYAAEDAEFQAALEYAQSESFKKLTLEVETIPEIMELMAYLDEAGIDIYMLVNKLNGAIGLDHRVPKFARMQKTTGGIRGLVDELLATLPADKIKELYYYKLENSKPFASFIDQLKSPKFQKIVNTVYANEHFQELLQNAKAAGLDLTVVKNLLWKVLGIEIPSNVSFYAQSELEADFQDFIKLLPVEKIGQVVVRYMAEDKEVQKALEYAYSQEFHEMAYEVESLKEYQEFVMYLNNAGVNVYKYIQLIHEFLGLDSYIPPIPVFRGSTTGGIRGMVDEVKALLPIDEIKALYHKKLETSKAFADFIAHIQSDNFQKIIDSLYKHEVYLNMLASAKAAGLDLEAIADFLHSVFGFEFPGH